MKIHQSMNRNSTYFILIVLLISCKGEDGAVGPSGLNSLIQTSTEPAGSNCEFGGLKVESGIDNNSNGTLDSDEVVKTDYVCSIAGNNSLVNVIDEPVGATCANGGLRIESGVDDNGDGTLGSDEIDVTRFICNGVDGGFDEQIRLIIFNSGTNNSGTSTTRQLGDLINFDKRNWVGVDSIVFIPRIFSSSATNTAFAELYDLTNGAVISNSTVSTTSTTATNLESINIYDDLPESEIDLTIQIQSEDPGNTALLNGKSYLMLYRKN